MPKNKKKSLRSFRVHLPRLSRRTYIYLGVGAFVVVTLLIFVLRSALPIAPHSDNASQRIDQPLRLSLGQKVTAVDLTHITISPQVKGTWKFERGAVLGGDSIIFTPASYFTVNTTYTIKNIQVDRIGIGTRHASDIAIHTEAAPSLANTGLVQLKNGQTIAADAPLETSLVSQNRGLRHLVLRTTPDIPLTMTTTADKTYHWKPAGYLPQGAQVVLELYDNKNNVSLLKRTVTIATEPSITSPTSRTRLVANDTVSITFSEPIEPASSKYISFSIPGDGVWKSPTEYLYTPKKLDPGISATYTVAPGLRTQKGGILADEQTGTFSTIGAVVVVGTSPHGSGLSQAAQTISFTFDQPVDHASAEKRFNVSAGTLTGFSWSGNTLRATVRDLGFQRTITASIAAGVVNSGFGLPSVGTFTTSFTTEIRSTRLSVPFYGQQHAGTCSAAALRMALAYRGIGSDEMGLVNAMGYAPRSKDTSTNPPTWDDSSQMFVGSVDGSIAAGTGAGPDAPPVAKAARAYGRGASAVTGISPSWIAEQLYAGNPVLMFGAFRANSGTTSWQTPTGKTIIMNLTGHVTTVIGVKGEPSNPLGFWVNDPLGGGTQYWSAGAVAANIARDPDRQAVVVY